MVIGLDINSLNLSNLYFKRKPFSDERKLTMDAETLRLLVAIDENKSASRISREIGMDAPRLKKSLIRLLKLNIIAPVKKAGAYLSQTFLEKTRFNFIKMVGPLGGAFFEDVVEDMNASLSEIPVGRTAELIDNLSMEINEKTKRVQFKESMALILREMRKTQ